MTSTTQPTTRDCILSLEVDAVESVQRARAAVTKYLLLVAVVEPAALSSPDIDRCLTFLGCSREQLHLQVDLVQQIARSLVRIRELSAEVESGSRSHVPVLIAARSQVEDLRQQRPDLIELAELIVQVQS